MESANISNSALMVADRIALWLARHWLALINVVVAVYVGLPFLAPVLEETGHPFPAHIIYTVYGALCHQLPQRSYFLYGEKAVYSLQDLTDRLGAEHIPPIPWSRWPESFNGNAQVGYKVALCQRDVAMYGALLLSGIAFSLVRSRVRPLPFWAYLLIGVVPIGVDGGSQLISYVAAWMLPNLGLVPRESTWVLRTITGAAFGWATAWLAYPHLQAAFGEVVEVSKGRLELVDRG